MANWDSPNAANSFSKLKTEKSTRRYEKAIRNTFLNFNSDDQKSIIEKVLASNGISGDSPLILFWNASKNNELLDYINTTVFFPAYYSGRLILKPSEIADCLNELKSVEKKLQKWTEKTIAITASKYLTLLKKFDLLEGSVEKSIKHPFLSDQMFVLFIYWLLTVKSKVNILDSSWLKYSFTEEKFFVERILQKRFAKFFEVKYTGDKLQIHPLIAYKDIYDVSTQS